MSINVNDKNLGHATAYAYYKAGGGTMTEAEFTEFMADFGTASQTAVEAAQAALASKNAAQTAATTATNKATEATTAATTATTKAGEASTSASTATSAKDTAVSASQTATSKATEATTAAATATSAKTDAVAANTAAQSAKTAAQTAQTGAETAAASVEASAEQIATNAEDISQLKSELSYEVVPRLKILDGEYYLSYDDFDIGNLNISDSGWNYNNWATRVRTREGVTISLKAGDVIHFEDYSTLRYYTGWRDGDGGYHAREWRQSDLVAPEDGEYVFLIANVPEAAPTSVVPLVSRMSITSPDSLKTDLLNLGKEIDENEVRSKAITDRVVYTTPDIQNLYMFAGETVDINVTALSSKTNAYINTDTGYSIVIESVGRYTFTARRDGYFSNYSFGVSDLTMNMEVQLRTRYDDVIDTTNYYTVDVNGSGDFTSFTACIKALENDSSKKVITVLEGDYNIYSEIGGASYVDSLSGTDWRSVNAIVPPNTVINGIGDVNLLYLPDTAAEVGKTLISPLNLSGNVEVHNINIHCQNCRYAIHLEGSALADFDNANILLDNVNIVRDKSLYARQVLGSGLNKGCTLIVKNCTWENTDSQNFYVHTNSLVKHPRIIVENCQFITHGSSSFYFSSENKVHNGEVLVRLNGVYADNSNITKADIQNGDCFHVIANGCNALTQSTFNTGSEMNDLEQYLTIS
jgi:carbon monoxide dehydrogenase subunit G